MAAYWGILSSIRNTKHMLWSKEICNAEYILFYTETTTVFASTTFISKENKTTEQKENKEKQQNMPTIHASEFKDPHIETTCLI